MENEFENRKAAIIAEIKGDERFTRFFEQYEESSVTRFIDAYAYLKALYEDKGNFYQDRQEYDTELMIDLAEACLKEIQYIKLLKLECQWRANQIQIPGIEISYDFSIIAETILESDVVDPVTEDELRMYQDYLRTPDATTGYMDSYDDLYNLVRGKETDDEFDVIPDFLDYYNLRTGASIYLELPNIRGEKEEFYMRLANVEHQMDADPWPMEISEDKKKLYSSHEEVIRMAEKVGDYELAGFVRDDNAMMEARDFEVEEAYEYLSELREMLPIQGGPDWREALVKLKRQRENEMLAEVLPGVWEDYLLRREMNIGVEPPSFLQEDFRALYLEAILRGRELNGEPRDLDF
jgi:hypothetical protein